MALTGRLANFKQPCQRYFAARWIKMSSECFYLSAHLSVLLCCLPGSGTLCASWQCLEVPRGPPPSLAVQFVGTGASLSGMDVELVGSRYRMSLVKKRFATGDYVNTLWFVSRLHLHIEHTQSEPVGGGNRHLLQASYWSILD